MTDFNEILLGIEFIDGEDVDSGDDIRYVSFGLVFFQIRFYF